MKSTNTLIAIAFAGSLIGCADESRSYVLVHGAFMGESGWANVEADLRSDGSTVTTLDLPAHGHDMTPASAASMEAYVAAVSAAIDASPRPVTLVGHSMGGMVISEVAEQRPQDIESLVYLAAYAPVTGDSLVALASSDAGSQLGAQLQFHEDGTIDIAQGHFVELFCPECDTAAAATLQTGYRAEPAAPLMQPVTLTDRFASVDKTYIFSSRDVVISPALQQQMVARQTFSRTATIDGSHALMLAAPAAVADAIRGE